MAAMLSSSRMDKVLPISSDLMEKPRSLLFPKEVLPVLNRRFSASAVWVWLRRISPKSVEGASSRHSFLPGSESALAASMSIILLYSRVFLTFSFIWGSFYECVTE